MNAKDASILFKDNIFAEQLQNHLHLLIKNDDFYDVLLETHGKQFKAHKHVLAAASEFFKEMFRHTGFKENTENLVRLETVEPEALKSILDFVYTSTIEINLKNVVAIMNAVDYLGIFGIRACIEQFLWTTKFSDNMYHILKMVDLFQYYDLKEHWLNNYIAEYYKILCVRTPLAPYRSGQVSINLINENHVKIVLEWVKLDLTYRIKFVPTLLDHFLMSRPPEKTLDEESVKLLEELDKIYQKLKNTELVKNSVDYSSNLVSLAYFEVVMIVGGLRETTALSSAESLRMSRWEEWQSTMSMYPDWASLSMARLAITPMNMARNKPAIAFDSSSVYVIGGMGADRQVLTSAEQYLLQANSWISLPDLPRPLEGCAACLADSLLFIFGGVNSTQLLVLDKKPQRQRWRIFSDLHFTRSYHCMVSALGYIFILGGINEKDEAMNTVWRLDTAYSHLVPVAPMLESRAYFGAIQIDGYIYVMGGTNKDGYLSSVERYDIFKNEWISLRKMFLPKALFGVVPCEKGFACVGGSDSFQQCCSFDKYNIAADLWHCQTSMRFGRSGVGAAIFKIPFVKTSNKFKSDSCLMNKFRRSSS